MHIFLHTGRLVLNTYNFTISMVFYIEFYVFYTKLYNHFRTIVLNSLTPITYKNKNSNVVGTQGSIQFICRPIVLHSNILNLAKSLIGIGMVRLAPILLSLISETSCFLGLLLMCHIRNPVGSLSVQQVSQHLLSPHSLTFTSWSRPETNCSISFRTIPVCSLMQTSRISTWFIMNYVKFARFTKMPKCADQQNKIQKCTFYGIYFPK